MPTEEWSEVKRRDDDFEVVDFDGFHANNLFKIDKIDIYRESEINNAQESFQRLSLKSVSNVLINGESSLTCQNPMTKVAEINHKKEANKNNKLNNTNSKENNAVNCNQKVNLTMNIGTNDKNNYVNSNGTDPTNLLDSINPYKNTELRRTSYDSIEDGDCGDDWITDEMVMSTSILSETNPPCIMLLNHNEELMVDDASSFIKQLNIDTDTKVKVVSIIGNTGEGKSHTFNETFCEGRHVFRTSSRQQAATIGCWAAYDPLHQAILLDTEGMLNNNQPIRLLLKVMAMSDVVIYRTRSERLHSDLFAFLGDADSILHQHFSTAHPSIIISHHTQHTELLAKGSREVAGGMLKRRFEEMGLSCKQYAGVHYAATKNHCNHGNQESSNCRRSSYNELLLLVKQLLSNQQLSSARSPMKVFKTLKTLNDRFSGPIPPSPSSSNHFFTCHATCLSCQSSCDNTMRHQNLPHHTTSPCTPNKLLNNTLYLCKKCFSKGSRRVVQTPLTGIASYAWSGYVLECGHCGVIYRSREHWFGNPHPEEDAVVMVTEHVWPGHSGEQGSSIESNIARRVVEGVAGVTECLAVPSKYVCEWVADQINPPYWEANHLIKTCRQCQVPFSEAIGIHHCRACGRGFCEACSSKTRAVPEMRWGVVPVRVCDRCYHQPPHSSPPPLTEHPAAMEGDVMARRVGEALGCTLGAVSSVLNYPLAALKEAARPDYWVSDDEATHCIVCQRPFQHHDNQQKNNNHRSNHRSNYHPRDNPQNFNFSNSSHGINNHSRKQKDGSNNTSISSYNNNQNINFHNTNNNIISSNNKNNNNIISSSNKNNNNFISSNNKNDNNSISNNNNNNNLKSNPNHSSAPLKLHHCRSCGQGVCGDCSGQVKKVTSRGWQHPVRVCDLCCLSGGTSM